MKNDGTSLYRIYGLASVSILRNLLGNCHLRLADMIAYAASETHRSIGEGALDMNGMTYVLIVALAWWPFLLRQVFISQGEPYWLSHFYSRHGTLFFLSPEHMKNQPCTSLHKTARLHSAGDGSSITLILS